MCPSPTLIVDTGCFRHATWVQAMRKESWWCPVRRCVQANGWMGIFGLRLGREDPVLVRDPDVDSQSAS